MRRSALALCLVAGLASCRQSTPAPTPRAISGLPALLVANGSSIRRYDQGRFTKIGSVDGTVRLAMDAGAHGVVVQRERNARTDLALIKDGAITTLEFSPAPHVDLHDVAVIDGKTRVLLDAYDEDSSREVKGYLMLGDIESRSATKVNESLGPEFGVQRAAIGGGVIVESANSDLTETISFHRPDGTRLDRPSPTDDLPYNSPPYVTQAVLSPDGTLLAHLEGPDVSGENPERRVGSWAAVVTDQRAKERLRIRVGNRSACLTWLDYDGRWLVISRQPGIGRPMCEPGTKASPVLVVDTKAGNPTPRELQGVSGTATIAE